MTPADQRRALARMAAVSAAIDAIPADDQQTPAEQYESITKQVDPYAALILAGAPVKTA